MRKTLHLFSLFSTADQQRTEGGWWIFFLWQSKYSFSNSPLQHGCVLFPGKDVLVLLLPCLVLTQEYPEMRWLRQTCVCSWGNSDLLYLWAKVDLNSSTLHCSTWMWRSLLREQALTDQADSIYGVNYVDFSYYWCYVFPKHPGFPSA